MNSTELALYLAGLAISLLTSAAVVVYLRRHLETILLELCGTRERAGFWVAFSNVSLILFPLILAVNHWPDAHEPGPLGRELAMQVGAALAGLLTAVVTLGIVLAIFIGNARPVAQPRA